MSEFNYASSELASQLDQRPRLSRANKREVVRDWRDAFADFCECTFASNASQDLKTDGTYENAVIAQKECNALNDVLAYAMRETRGGRLESADIAPATKAIGMGSLIEKIQFLSNGKLDSPMRIVRKRATCGEGKVQQLPETTVDLTPVESDGSIADRELDIRKVVSSVLKEVTHREQMMTALHYALCDGNGYTHKEIAALYERHPSRVEDIIHKVLRKLALPANAMRLPILFNL